MEGFKVYEDINRYKTEEYAQVLIKAVEFGLEKGFDPFVYEQKVFSEFQQSGQTPKKVWWSILPPN